MESKMILCDTVVINTTTLLNEYEGKKALLHLSIHSSLHYLQKRQTDMLTKQLK